MLGAFKAQPGRLRRCGSLGRWLLAWSELPGHPQCRWLQESQSPARFAAFRQLAARSVCSRASRRVARISRVGFCSRTLRKVPSTASPSFSSSRVARSRSLNVGVSSRAIQAATCLASTATGRSSFWKSGSVCVARRRGANALGKLLWRPGWLAIAKGCAASPPPSRPAAACAAEAVGDSRGAGGHLSDRERAFCHRGRIRRGRNRRRKRCRGLAAPR